MLTSALSWCRPARPAKDAKAVAPVGNAEQLRHRRDLVVRLIACGDDAAGMLVQPAWGFRQVYRCNRPFEPREISDLPFVAANESNLAGVQTPYRFGDRRRIVVRQEPKRCTGLEKNGEDHSDGKHLSEVPHIQRPQRDSTHERGGRHQRHQIVSLLAADDGQDDYGRKYPGKNRADGLPGANAAAPRQNAGNSAQGRKSAGIIGR